MKRAQVGCLLYVAALIVSGCGSSGGSSKPDGAAGSGGAGTTGASGTGGAGTTGSAGMDGGAGTTGAAGSDAAGGTTGAAGSDGGAGTTGAAGADGGGSDVPAGNDGSTDVATDGTDAVISTCTSPASTNLVNTAGTNVGAQSFAEMRVLEITASGDAVVTALVIDGYSPGEADMIGARIYDATSHALVASGSKAVAANNTAAIEVPISATLTAGKAYRVGFLGGAHGNGELFQPTTKPYTVGAFQVTGVYQSNDDTFPANVNIYAPKMTIKACVAAASDGGTSDAAGDGGGACNALNVQGAQITKTTHAGAAPTMTGGAITAGTYLLTAMDKYNGTQGSNTHRETWVFTAGHVEIASENSDSGSVVQRYSANYTTSNNGISLTFTCPAALAGMVKTAQYTATSTTIQSLGEPNSTDQEIHTMTRQQ